MNETESGAVVLAKLTPPAGVTLASLMGLPISDLVLWVTFIYTVLLIAQKTFLFAKDVSNWYKSKGAI